MLLLSLLLLLLLLILPFFLFITETSSPLKSQIIVPIAGGGDTQPFCVMRPQLLSTFH